MAQKLKAIILDDEPHIIKIIQALCKDSPYVEIVRIFTNPAEFIENAPEIDFDLAMLDVQMPEMEGTVVAQMLKNKAFIFITGSKEKLQDALGLSPIDIVTKPILKDRLNNALEKAHKLLIGKREFGLFNTAESKRKRQVFLPDIMIVTTDEHDPRNKIIYMRHGEMHTIMNSSLENLLEICPLLVQVNRKEAVSLEAVHEVEYEMVLLKKIPNDEAPKHVTLGNAFSKSFKERMYY